MKVAIMQPYIFPYIGYYQLINSVDKFVILDDVNFIMRGWINRNNILINGKPSLFSLPLNKPSQNTLICNTKLNFSIKDKEKFLKTIQLSYKKSPFFNDFYPILEGIVFFEDDDLTSYLQKSIVDVCNYLELKTEIVRSSKIIKDNSLIAQDRIIEICKKLNTNTYINLSGGKSLYHKNNFEKENMELKFINTLFDNIRYKQYKFDFISNLSFIDVLMFNSKSEIINLLNQYTLCSGED